MERNSSGDRSAAPPLQGARNAWSSGCGGALSVSPALRCCYCCCYSMAGLLASCTSASLTWRSSWGAATSARKPSLSHCGGRGGGGAWRCTPTGKGALLLPPVTKARAWHAPDRCRHPGCTPLGPKPTPYTLEAPLLVAGGAPTFCTWAPSTAGAEASWIAAGLTWCSAGAPCFTSCRGTEEGSQASHLQEHGRAGARRGEVLRQRDSWIPLAHGQHVLAPAAHLHQLLVRQVADVRACGNS